MWDAPDVVKLQVSRTRATVTPSAVTSMRVRTRLAIPDGFLGRESGCLCSMLPFVRALAGGQGTGSAPTSAAAAPGAAQPLTIGQMGR